MDSIDVMDRLTQVLNEAKEAGYEIGECLDEESFYVALKNGPVLGWVSLEPNQYGHYWTFKAAPP